MDADDFGELGGEGSADGFHFFDVALFEGSVSEERDDGDALLGRLVASHGMVAGEDDHGAVAEPLGGGFAEACFDFGAVVETDEPFVAGEGGGEDVGELVEHHLGGIAGHVGVDVGADGPIAGGVGEEDDGVGDADAVENELEGLSKESFDVELVGDGGADLGGDVRGADVVGHGLVGADHFGGELLDLVGDFTSLVGELSADAGESLGSFFGVSCVACALNGAGEPLGDGGWRHREDEDVGRAGAHEFDDFACGEASCCGDDGEVSIVHAHFADEVDGVFESAACEPEDEAVGFVQGGVGGVGDGVGRGADVASGFFDVVDRGFRECGDREARCAKRGPCGTVFPSFVVLESFVHGSRYLSLFPVSVPPWSSDVRRFSLPSRSSRVAAWVRRSLSGVSRRAGRAEPPCA